MTKNLEITVINDNSVYKKLKKTNKKLSKKFGTRREINEKKLNRYSSVGGKIFSCVTNSLLVIMVVGTLLVSFACVYGRIKKTVPTFAGFSYMQVVTGSMTKESIIINGKEYSSGHKKGDNIVIRAVDTNTLKEGDKIAFYVDGRSFNDYKEAKSVKIADDARTVKYKTTLGKFIGFQPRAVTNASARGCKLVFHHIIEVYEDANGVRWFKTQGSSNDNRDNWVIKEDYIIGIYDDSKIGAKVSSVLGFITSKTGMVVTLLVPLLLLGLLLIIDFLKNAERAKLELDCIQEKRKITDPICIKNNIGYGMSNKTKLKVLAQAEPEEWMHYISLLWKNGKAPNSIKKYAIRKNIKLRPIKKKLELNRTCEFLYGEGLEIGKLSKYYLLELEKIEQYEERIKRKLKAISKVGI